MIEAKDAALWVNRETKQVRITAGPDRSLAMAQDWCDPIGAAYDSWNKATEAARVQLMLETAIELTMHGFNIGAVLREMAKVRQFKHLGEESWPMCRALTMALLGRCLEPNTMGFEDLLRTYQEV